MGSCPESDTAFSKPLMRPSVLRTHVRALTESRHATTRNRETVVCLVSGGIDSPVAVWLTAKKGLMPVCVYFDNSPYADETTRQRALETMKRLKQHIAEDIKFYIVSHGANLTEILEKCPRNLTCVLCKRMMYRVAEKIALKENAEAIVTGEIIGEHASQTLRNLHIETEALSKVTILRPLAGLNKTEVEQLARKIGTFEASAQPASCCKAPPAQPRTRARPEEVAFAEKKLDINAMVRCSLENMSFLTV